MSSICLDDWHQLDDRFIIPHSLAVVVTAVIMTVNHNHGWTDDERGWILFTVELFWDRHHVRTEQPQDECRGETRWCNIWSDVGESQALTSGPKPWNKHQPSYVCDKKCVLFLEQLRPCSTQDLNSFSQQWLVRGFVGVFVYVEKPIGQ